MKILSFFSSAALSVLLATATVATSAVASSPVVPAPTSPVVSKNWHNIWIPPKTKIKIVGTDLKLHALVRDPNNSKVIYLYGTDAKNQLFTYKISPTNMEKITSGTIAPVSQSSANQALNQMNWAIGDAQKQNAQLVSVQLTSNGTTPVANYTAISQNGQIVTGQSTPTISQ